MTREELIRQILAIVARAMRDVGKDAESDWVGILSDALDDIETLCKEATNEREATMEGEGTTWKEIREHLNLLPGAPLDKEQCAAMSLLRFERSKDNPLVQALEYFIRGTLGVELSDVMSWHIEANMDDEKPFWILLRDDRQITGKIAQRWNVRDFTERPI